MSYIHSESPLAHDKLPKDSLLYGDVLQIEIQAKLLSGQLVQPVRPSKSRLITNADDILDAASLLATEFCARGYDLALSSDASDQLGRRISRIAVTTPRNDMKGVMDLYHGTRSHPVRSLLYMIGQAFPKTYDFVLTPSLAEGALNELNKSATKVFSEDTDVSPIAVRGLLSKYVLDTWRMNSKNNGVSMDILARQYQTLREQTNLSPFTAEELGAIAAKAVRASIHANPDISVPNRAPQPLPMTRRNRYRL